MDTILRRLADLFHADGIGWTRLDTTAPDLAFFAVQPLPLAFPWQRDARLPARFETALCAEAVHDNAGEWLITLVWEPGATKPSRTWLFRSSGPGLNDTDPWLKQCDSGLLMRQ
ncbi:MAG: hypothetical protein EXR98_12145 [Gemmataceae bacterium]|nr:hypothetical protein [Gemmataceae bacterium]